MPQDPSESQPPKLIVDDDWKREAQAEKARLAEQQKAKEAKQAESDDGPQGPVGFDDLVKTLASQAMVYLGYVPDPQTGKAIVAPEYARLYIDFLGILEEKTEGNLDDEESKLLSSMANELRMAFVEVSKAVAKAIQEGKIKPQDLGGGGMQPPPPPGGIG